MLLKIVKNMWIHIIIKGINSNKVIKISLFLVLSNLYILISSLENLLLLFLLVLFSSKIIVLLILYSRLSYILFIIFNNIV